LLKLDMESLAVVEPTVMAAGTKAGEKPQASELLLPAATTTAMPLFTADSMAVLYATLVPGPPRLMLIADPFGAFAEIQSMAPVIQDVWPDGFKTFTAWIVADLATP